ncbi:hypothetical protein P8452_05980 [Trifolium repens]|nr:hypothetical protein P8452_05980 [Trifolium repens]
MDDRKKNQIASFPFHKISICAFSFSLQQQWNTCIKTLRSASFLDHKQHHSISSSSLIFALDQQNDISVTPFRSSSPI